MGDTLLIHKAMDLPMSAPTQYDTMAKCKTSSVRGHYAPIN